MAYLKFLSRLCGGELAFNPLFADVAFLSRLCGGEPEVLQAATTDIFLSRLCGGELKADGFEALPYFSKPPMWR